VGDVVPARASIVAARALPQGAPCTLSAVKPTLYSLCFLASLAVVGSPAAAPARCGPGEVLFHGKCVAPNECCDETLCPAGTVLEFQKAPRCVPCADAATQQGMNFCRAADLRKADATLNADYKKLLADFPELAKGVRETERLWVQFRDKLCDTTAVLYEGGSLQPFVRTSCLLSETHRHIDRLAELRRAWTPDQP
jgi:uncharacterized protein YecT (DUF1311 family)